MANDCRVWPNVSSSQPRTRSFSGLVFHLFCRFLLSHNQPQKYAYTLPSGALSSVEHFCVDQDSQNPPESAPRTFRLTRLMLGPGHPRSQFSNMPRLILIFTMFVLGESQPSTKKTGACRRKLIQPTVSHASLHAETHTSSLNPKPLNPKPKPPEAKAVCCSCSRLVPQRGSAAQSEEGPRLQYTDL